MHTLHSHTSSGPDALRQSHKASIEGHPNRTEGHGGVGRRNLPSMCLEETLRENPRHSINTNLIADSQPICGMAVESTTRDVNRLSALQTRSTDVREETVSCAIRPTVVDCRGIIWLPSSEMMTSTQGVSSSQRRHLVSARLLMQQARQSGFGGN